MRSLLRGGGGRSGAVPETVSGYITNDIFAERVDRAGELTKGI